MYFSAENIHKTWDSVTVETSIECEKEKLLCILGPSGCGKSTILNIIAGLEENDKTHQLKITLDNRRIEKLSPSKRNVGMVFQSGALFNHMTVVDNVAYGLVSSGMKKKAAREMASDFLREFNLEGFDRRYPQTLSGGERQRVALARTLITKPALVLLDEPFSALDADLRKKLAGQLVEWKNMFHFTGIMVTHDEEEARTVGDSLIFLNKK